MIEVSFVVRGNQENPEGNPVPYQRTLNHSWTRAATRYRDWQEYVRAEFSRSAKIRHAPGEHPEEAVDMARGAVKIPPGHEAEVELQAVFGSGARGDLDNVLKGILDALFEQDRDVVHVEATAMRGRKGLVAGRITITEAMQ